MRRVVVLCGPPGAGKSSAARASGLPVFDRDDRVWSGEVQFRRELARLRDVTGAQAVVIRSGATSSARLKAAQLVRASHVFLVVQPRDVLASRIVRRGRPDWEQSLAALDGWFARFDDADGVSIFPGWPNVFDTPRLGVRSFDW